MRVHRGSHVEAHRILSRKYHMHSTVVWWKRTDRGNPRASDRVLFQ